MKVELPIPFVNENGTIQNITEAGCQTVSIIRSRAGAIRANHWHRTDDHRTFIVSGSVIYLARPVGSRLDSFRENVAVSRLYRAGEAFYTPPEIEHCMVFPEDTVIITMARNIKDHLHHEADVVRVQWIDATKADELIAYYRPLLECD